MQEIGTLICCLILQLELEIFKIQVSYLRFQFKTGLPKLNFFFELYFKTIHFLCLKI